MLKVKGPSGEDGYERWVLSPQSSEVVANLQKARADAFERLIAACRKTEDIDVIVPFTRLEALDEMLEVFGVKRDRAAKRIGRTGSEKEGSDKG